MSALAPSGLPRLLAGLDGMGGAMSLTDHERVHGPLPAHAPADLIDAIERSGLRGRGGADFPTAVKLRAVAGRGTNRRPPAVVVNGSETEPASGKDKLLLCRTPHLVLDGAQLAAEAVGAADVVIHLGDHARQAARALHAAFEMRAPSRVTFEIVVGPDGYVTGEESAVVHHLNRGLALPTLVPPRPYERGYRGRPTLVQNPETLAQIALVARHGDRWYRELGTADDPGSALVTISGAVAYPGVYELAFGTPMPDLIAAAGGAVEPLQALLVGGYFGTWMPAADEVRLKLARADLESVGCRLGSGVIVALGQSACGLHESARIISYLADQSAGQCGPCVHGLAAIADSFAALTDGVGHHREQERIARWCVEVTGRGACHHPDGAVRFVESALHTFGRAVDEHRRRRCHAPAAGLPLGAERSAGSEIPIRSGARRKEFVR